MTEKNEFETSASLLRALSKTKGRDELAWKTFTQNYEPLIRAGCRKEGLGPAEEDEVTQAVLAKLVEKLPTFQYDPNKGRFRGWLIRFVKNLITDLRRMAEQRPGDQGTGLTWVREALDAVPDWSDAEEMARELEEQIGRNRLVFAACERVRDRVEADTWQAFWLKVVEGQKGTEVAKALGKSPAAVYVARDRVIKMILQEIERDRRLGPRE